MQESAQTHSPRIVCVDLDGTLVRSDLFAESIILLVRKNPLNFVRILAWLAKGRAYAKERVSESVELDIDSLPLEAELVDYLQQQKSDGKRLILTTASHRRNAEQIASRVGLFDEVIATDRDNNLKGSRKLQAIRERIGSEDFAYAGDSRADHNLWKEARSCLFVNAPKTEIEIAKAESKADLIIHSRPSLWRTFLRGMRPHQYAKNSLVFVPLFTSHLYTDVVSFVAAVLAFVCFSLCASGVYFANDLLDLSADRRHRKKHRRPLASGDLPIAWGLIGTVCLPLLALGLALAFLPLLFTAVLASYFLASNAYSFVLKRHSTIDVITLSVLYTSRIIAGSAATGIALSFWLMAFSVFLFVSLAYLKRYIEVAALSKNESKAHGRGYSAADRETMFTLGISNFTGAVMVLALYINSEEVIRSYQTPELLWPLCLLVLFWGNRVWVGARRGKIADDPVVFALKDRVSGAVGVLSIGVVLAAKNLAI